uniref:Uncharacterized protein n=1 Tax=Hanusia phi TaxID=3032 RepID=A0A7S0F3M9_9CRYP
MSEVAQSPGKRSSDPREEHVRYRYNVFGARGGVFSEGKLPTSIDLEIRRKKNIPGPGSYSPKKRQDNEGVRFSTAKPKTELEWIEYYKSKMPGPGQYQVPITHRGRLVSEPRYVRFPTGKAKSDLEWKILRSQKIPGPGQYHCEIDFIGSRTAKQELPLARPATKDPSEDLERLKTRALRLKAIVESVTPEKNLRSPYENPCYDQITKLKKEVRKKILRQAYTVWGKENGSKHALLQSLQPYLQNKAHKSGPAVRSQKHRGESDPELQHLIEVLAEPSSVGDEDGDEFKNDKSSLLKLIAQDKDMRGLEDAKDDLVNVLNCLEDLQSSLISE